MAMTAQTENIKMIPMANLKTMDILATGITTMDIATELPDKMGTMREHLDKKRSSKNGTQMMWKSEANMMSLLSHMNTNKVALSRDMR
jgi:hypothetical protein